MARRSDHSRDELYELVLAAARRIVENEGLRGLTARNVAVAVGYSPGTLYNLFENLDDLIVHLNGRTLDHLGQRLAALELSGEPEADVLALLDCYLAFETENQHLWNVLFEHKGPAGAVLSDWYIAKVGRVLGVLEDALSPLFRGDAGDGKRLAARTLWASLHGITSLSQSEKLEVITRETPRRMAQHLAVHYVAGLARR